jgi:hypothetical protein
MADGLGVLGIFQNLDELIKAFCGMEQTMRKKAIVYAPAIPYELANVLFKKPSPVRYITLLGGILGCLSGFALCTYTHLKWGIVLGGKPVVSLPPTALVMFELTILFGGLSNLLGLLIFSKMPKWKLPGHYDIRFTQDMFGIFIPCENNHFQEAELCLLDAGAAEIIRTS